MDLLNTADTPRPTSGAATRPGSRRLLFVALGALVASCALFGSVEEPVGPFFSHRIHVVYEDGPMMDCDMCHDTDAESGLPMLPPREACAGCHDEWYGEGLEEYNADSSDEEREIAENIYALFDADGGYLAKRFSALPDEVVFDHQGHVDREIECSTCHGDFQNAERLTADMGIGVDMSACMECHAEKQAPNDCRTCHSEIDRNYSPQTHQQNWMRQHGRVVRAHSEATVDDCAMCHTENSCNSCHREQQPQSHNNYFRLRGHGIDASMDRDSCLACHRTDFCQRCHENTPPLSHRSATFGSPRSSHCVGCHEPLKTTSCFTCHKDAPSHRMAPPKPMDHNPAMNCRLCHGAGLPLSHVDNGSDCNSCHR